MFSALSVGDEADGPGRTMPERLSRRRVLAFVSSGAAVAIAGCPENPGAAPDTDSNGSGDGDGDSDGNGDSSTPASSENTSETSPSDTAPTPTQNSSQTPTPEPIEEYFQVETNNATEQIEITFGSDDRLQVFEIEITGAERSKLNETDFQEEAVDGGYVYSAAYQVAREGTYNLSFARLTGARLGEPPYNRTRTATFDLSAPTLLSFSATNPSESRLKIRLVTDEQLDGLFVDVRGTGGYRKQFDRRDFTESGTSEGSYAYETTTTADQGARYVLDLEYVEDRFENRNEVSKRYYVTLE